MCLVDAPHRTRHSVGDSQVAQRESDHFLDVTFQVTVGVTVNSSGAAQRGGRRHRGRKRNVWSPINPESSL